MSFRLKTILGVALIEAVLLAILIGSVLSILHDSNETQLRDYARVRVSDFAALSKDSVLGMDLARLQTYVDELARTPSVTYARIRDGQGRLLAVAGGKEALSRPFQTDDRLDDVDDQVYDVAQTIHAGGVRYGQVEMGIDVSSLREVWGQARQRSLTIAAVEMGLVALFSLILGSYLTRQLARLEEGARRLQAGELGYQVAVVGSDELAATTRTFNTMSQQLLRDQQDHQARESRQELVQEQQQQQLERLVMARTIELAQAEERARLALESSASGMCGLDLQGRITFINAAACEMLGYVAEQVIGLDSHALWHAHLADGSVYAREDCPTHQSLREGRTITGREDLFWHADGHAVPVMIASRPIISAGVSIGAVLSFVDISEHRALQHTLREQERDLRALVDNIPDVIMRFDPAGRVAYTGPNVEHELGIVPADLQGRTLGEYAPDSSEACRFDAVVRGALATGEPGEIEFSLPAPRGGARIHHVRLVAERDEAQHVVGVLAIGRDITDIKQAEQQLALLSFALDRVGEAAMLLDQQGRILYANQGLSVMLGYAPDELRGMRLADLRRVFDAEHWSDFWQRAQRQGALVYEAVNYTKDGQAVTLEVNANYIDYEGQGYILALGRDISERKQLEKAREQALIEAERLAQAKSDFLANMSHEIRTPLNAVLGMAQLGLRQSRGKQVMNQFAGILDAGQLLLGLINDILDFSKIEAGQLSLEQAGVDLGQIIDRALEMTVHKAYAKGLDFSLDEAADLPVSFTGDALRLSQVLVNLLSNAVKFTEQGQVRLQVSRDQEVLVLRVEDSGIGMDEEQLQALFSPFHQADGSTTRRFGGTGLGLVISKRLVSLMGGEIEVRSLPGQGSVFEVRLPVRGMVFAPPRPPRRVCLLGLEAGDALCEALRQRGLEARVCDERNGLDESADLYVLACRLLAEPSLVEKLRQVVEAGHAVAVATEPNWSPTLPASLLDRLRLLDWPLRARQLVQAVWAEPLPPVPMPVLGATNLAGVRVLAAEDNEVNRDVLREMLELQGASIVSVDNGRELVDRLRQDGAARYDVVITDIQMPEMDGYTAARYLQALAPRLPVIGLTAYAQTQDRDRCLASGMVAHLSKPVDIKALTAAILACTGRTGADGDALPTSAASPADDHPQVPGMIDWQELVARFAGNQAIVLRLADTLLRSHAKTPDLLRELADQQRWPELATLAHNLKGMAGNLLAQSVQAIALQLNEAALRGQADSADLAHRLAEELGQLLTEARQRVEREA